MKKQNRRTKEPNSNIGESVEELIESPIEESIEEIEEVIKPKKFGKVILVSSSYIIVENENGFNQTVNIDINSNKFHKIGDTVEV